MVAATLWPTFKWVNRIGQPKHFKVSYSPKNPLNKKKARFSRPLVGVEGGGYMLQSRAQSKVDQGLAIIVNGLVRFLKEDRHPGYDAAPGYGSFNGKTSFDPVLGGGPQVVQFFRRRKRIRKNGESGAD